MESYSYNAFMRNWKLGIKDPYSIFLAVDQRISESDYLNNQIWKLDLGLSEPPSVQLSTSFGFRAQNMRIFPQFTENFNVIQNPSEFVKPPQIEFFAPNFVSINYEPFLGISVNQEIHIPDSQTISGIFEIKNSGGKDRSIIFDLIALLNPDSIGHTIQPIKKEISSVLSGKTSELHPVLFITGGAEGASSPYPSLRHSLLLKPGETRTFNWAMASLEDQNLSFQHARKMTATNWPAEKQKIKILASRSIDIKTGNLAWDSAFAFSQSIAKSLLVSKTEHIPYPSFIQVLHPDYGFSPSGEGFEYGHLWNGQTVFDTWHLANILLPAEPEMIKGFLRNFISTQKEDGFIDGKPGPAGQRQNQLAAPLIAQIALKVFEIDQDENFLASIYESLIAFFCKWFSFNPITGSLEIPVWNNIIQTNFEFNPLFTHWELNGQGANINKTISPDLLSYLFREVISLQEISKIIGKDNPKLKIYKQALRDWLLKSWDRKFGKFRYQDINNQRSQRGKNIFSTDKNGEHAIHYKNDLAERFMLKVNINDVSASNLRVNIKALDLDNKSVNLVLRSRNFIWILGNGVYTIPKMLKQITSIKISNLPKLGKVTIKKVNHQQTDHNSYLPIYSGILSKEDVSRMIDQNLNSDANSLKKNGIPALLKPLRSFDSNLKSIYLQQNHMIIEGLYASGFRKEATEIFVRIMNAVSKRFKKEKSFSRFYHAEKDSSSGEPNIISGLPSISLFLQLLGMKIFSPWKIEFHGFNPFPWDVEIKYRGLQIKSFHDHIRIKFPNGKEKMIYDPTPCVIQSNP